MSGSKAPDFGAYGLLRATHSHNPTRYEHKNNVTVQSQPPKCYAFRRCGVSAKENFKRKQGGKVNGNTL